MSEKIQMLKRIPALIYTSLALCLAFSLLCFSFSADISLLALPLTLVITLVMAYFSIFLFIKKSDISKLFLIRKLYEYLPFVTIASFVFRRIGAKQTPYVLDFISAILWVVILVLSFVILHYLDDKRFYKQNPAFDELRKSIQVRKPSKGQRVIIEILEWIDAFLQAAFTVSLINIFILQLYEIPSESMVPEFLIKDRVVVFKTASGPNFPLSDVGLPQFRSYKRGDIVVFRNPHYITTRESEVRNYIAQLVYMLTFSSVNLNVDKYGNQKADPLVKRVTGEPGEQLMLMDGTLYARTKDTSDFKPVASDSTWAEWNVSSLPDNLKSKVASIPITADQYELMIKCEQERNALNYGAAQSEAASLAERFTDAVNKLKALSSESLQSSTSDYSKMYNDVDLFEYNMFVKNDTMTRRLMSVAGGTQWFSAFMTEWASTLPENYFSSNFPKPEANNKDFLVGGDLYADANFRLNLMIKLTFGRIVVRNAELIVSGVSSSAISRDIERLALLEDAEMLNNYVMLLDLRNMPVFPANDKNGNAQFIPENNYFMMGDNRFNSLDMRHSYDETLTSLTPFDPYSTTYYSNMEPQYVNENRILGTTVLRFWPFNRIAIPGHTGK